MMAIVMMVTKMMTGSEAKRSVEWKARSEVLRSHFALMVRRRRNLEWMLETAWKKLTQRYVRREKCNISKK